MPGSNAQMHQGAQDKADSLMNGSLSLANWTGVMKAVNQEMETTQKNLEQQVANAKKTITGHGPTLHPPEPKWSVTPTPGAPPPTPAPAAATPPPAAAPQTQQQPPGAGKVVPWSSLPES
jgi:hypothetical protein